MQTQAFTAPRLFLTAVMVAGGALWPTQALAQTMPVQSMQIQGLAITPFLIEAELEPGQPKEYSIALANTTDRPLTFEVSVNDFTTDGHSGQPLFLPANQQADPKYSLSGWITVTRQPQFTLPAGGQTEIKFSITPPADAEYGTRYGGLLFSQPLAVSGSQNTAVQDKAGVVILGKLGRASEQVRISKFSTTQGFYRSGQVEFSLTAQNTGNVHSKPKGDVHIRNMFGKEVGNAQINRDALIVLPETERQFTTSWNPQWAFGRYTAEAVIYFGNPKLELRAQTAFWIIPILPLAASVALAVALIGLFYVIIKRYNSFIIKRAKK